MSWMDQYEAWRGVIIEDIKEDAIKIWLRHKQEDDESRSFWITCNNETTPTFNDKPVVKYIDRKPFDRYCIPPYPAYYYNKISNKHYVIISLNDRSSDCGEIFFYDIDKNEYVDKIFYPENFKPERHGITVNSDTHTIHFYYRKSKFGGDPNETYFAIYNILTKQWNVTQHSDFPLFGYPRTFWIDDSMYIQSSTSVPPEGVRVMKYSPQNKKCTNLTKNFLEKNVKYSRMCYDEMNRRIMLFGGRGGATDDDEDGAEFDDIWIYDIDQNEDDGTEKWELYSLKLPHKNSKELVYAFNSIIFVIYCYSEQNEIWCLELMNDKWFKSNVDWPYELSSCDFVKVDNNHIHCINYHQNIHARINLYDIIPIELIEFYGKYYLPFVYGYIRIEFESKCDGVYVSQDLKHLIAKYFNAFL